MGGVSELEPVSLACEALGSSADAVLPVTPVKHGLTNQSWIVRTTSATVVVRISRGAEDLLQIDRITEAAVLGRVAQAKRCR